MLNIFQKIWQKIKQNHLLMMAICCLVPIALIIILLPLFKGSGDYAFWIIILLCPILHIWMMKGHKHDDSDEHKMIENNKTNKD